MSKLKHKLVRSTWLLAALMGAVVPTCFGGDVVFLTKRGEVLPEQQQLEVVARFYGLSLKALEVQSKSDVAPVLDQLRNSDTLAVVAAADILSFFPKKPILLGLRRKSHKSVPLLVVAVTPETNTQEIRDWSDDIISDCTPVSSDFRKGSYAVGVDRSITADLSGEELPVVSAAICSFSTAEEGAVEALISVPGQSKVAPVFVKTSGASSELFFLAQTKPSLDSRQIGGYAKLIRKFSQLAPLMMFVRHAAGEYAWHSVQHTANFTIDDPWLTEPYGDLNFRALSEEMAKHDFHTTIAFIPWNWDRSERAVAELFREHPERFSISIHGNNHNHKEFSNYASISLGDQIADIKQGVARMERFNALTQIPYDRVMVFPHSIAPEETLAALKKYDFLATVNSDDVPLGAEAPDDALFALRPFTLRFGNLPSLQRYSVEIPLPHLLLAINSFLDNPLLLYGHASLFDRGINAFDDIADAVNRTQPGTYWCSLGCVAQHLYLIRLRPDGNLDAELFGSDVTLENTSKYEKWFFVHKNENLRPSIRSLTVDGREKSFEAEAGGITLNVFVPAGGSRHIQITYKNDLDLAEIATARRGVWVSLLRHASDFRDITLPKYPRGRSLARFYYGHNLSEVELELEKRWVILLVLPSLSIGLLVFKRRAARKKLEASLVRPTVGLIQ